MPITLSGRRVAAPSRVIEIEEVFENHTDDVLEGIYRFRKLGPSGTEATCRQEVKLGFWLPGPLRRLAERTALEQSVAEFKDHAERLQAQPARQQVVMVDERLHRVEQRRAQSGLMRAACRRGNEVDVALGDRSALLVPGERPGGTLAIGERVSVLRLAEIAFAGEDRRDRRQAGLFTDDPPQQQLDVG